MDPTTIPLTTHTALDEINLYTVHEQDVESMKSMVLGGHINKQQQYGVYFDFLVCMQGYARALIHGVEAAETGFSVANEVITLAEGISSVSSQDVQSYINGMGHLSLEFNEKAKNCIDALNNVEMAISKLKARCINDMNTTLFHEYLKKSEHENTRRILLILDLLLFRLSSLKGWWQDIVADTSLLDSIEIKLPQEPHILQLSPFPDMIQKWTHVKEQFFNYVKVVANIESSYGQNLREQINLTTQNTQTSQLDFIMTHLGLSLEKNASNSAVLSERSSIEVNTSESARIGNAITRSRPTVQDLQCQPDMASKVRQKSGLPEEKICCCSIM